MEALDLTGSGIHQRQAHTESACHLQYAETCHFYGTPGVGGTGTAIAGVTGVRQAPRSAVTKIRPKHHLPITRKPDIHRSVISGAGTRSVVIQSDAS